MSGGQQTVACRPNLAGHLFLQIKFSWNTTRSIHLCIVYGCFLTTTAEVRNCYTKAENIYSVTLTEQVSSSALEQQVLLPADLYACQSVVAVSKPVYASYIYHCKYII